MKKIKVIIKGKTLLELDEDASKGDLIDLEQLVAVDTSYLEALIEEGKDKIYQSKLENVKKTLNDEKIIEINKLNSTIELIKNENANALKLKEKEVAENYAKQISKLTQEIEVMKSTKESEINALKDKNEANLSKVLADEKARYLELENKYNIIMTQHEDKLKQISLELESFWKDKLNEVESKARIALEKKSAEIENTKLKMEAKSNELLNNQKSKFEEELKSKEELINNLQRAKASMNVKQTGEDLEAWCDNEVNSYMQNGLFNCTWIKDNKVVKNETESKGSKADFIFNIYASERHLANELLSSICLEMKDENPDSVNRKSNADYYKQLDNNREKKNCKYAVLVSNLEMDKPNLLPIFKVREYENMYVVRPAYLMVFLNMIASLTTRFANLVLSKEKEILEFKSKNELLEEFEKIKGTYLDKPLESLKKNVEAIMASSEIMKKECSKIDTQCEKINKSYIEKIVNKLSTYGLKLNKDIVNKVQ